MQPISVHITFSVDPLRNPPLVPGVLSFPCQDLPYSRSTPDRARRKLRQSCPPGLREPAEAMVQVSYMILQRVSPVTHSIGNCLKRVIVIVASVLVFHNPMSRQNMIGASTPTQTQTLILTLPLGTPPSQSSVAAMAGHRLHAD